MNKLSRTEFGQRMREARINAGLKQVDVCKALGISQGTLSELEKESYSSKRLAEFAALYRVNPLWLATGDTGGTATVQASSATRLLPLERGGVDLPMSQGGFETFHVMTWEQVMSKDQNGVLSGMFVAQAPDDAMAPMARAGNKVLFEGGGDAPTGAGVIVRDKTGALYFRQKRQGTRPGVWIAHAENPAYRSLQSDTDALTIVAVMRAALRGWEEV